MFGLKKTFSVDSFSYTQELMREKNANAQTPGRSFGIETLLVLSKRDRLQTAKGKKNRKGEKKTF